MEKSKSILTIFLLAFSLLGSAALAQSSGELLQEGLYAQEVEGNLDKAIKIYQRIIDDSSAQRAHVAQALYRQGTCYLKEQNEQQAKAVFEKLVSQYSEQTDVIDKVRPLLAKMVSPDPAALMPPETLIYLEFGSPGKQIETILNMLKGTPFENPLAAMNRGASTGQQPGGGRTPGDMMAALLNPSMVAEFKKIRGMAIGFTEVRENNPPGIAVLYPGESDALRGIIMAGLGMIAQPGEPIEGMQTVQVHNMVGAAYDDNVIIVAQPLELLTWCVKQYQGVTDEPTLASNNECFANVSRQARQENAFTIWANVSQAFTALMEQHGEGELPEEMIIADTMLDPKNIDEMIAYVSIEENRIAVEANVAFKEGHHSVAYNSIRTPSISKNGFQGVPADAVGLFSIALGESDGPGVEKAQEAVESMTGLDIGREIFANIEQITVFAAPSSQGVSAESDISLLPYLGIAITSKNPQKTHYVVTRLLNLVNMAAALSEGEGAIQQSNVAAGKYLLPMDWDKEVYCYVGQAGKTTTIAFSPDVLEKSLSAIKSGKSALTGDMLQGSLREITPDASKMALVNVGGAIQLADTCITAVHENPRNPGHKIFAQLAQNFNKTSVQFRTRENVDNFNVHVSVDNLPPLDSVVPLLMQLSAIDITAKVKATQPRPRDGDVVSPKADVKLSWRTGATAASHKVYFGKEEKVKRMALLAETNSHEVKVPQIEEGVQYFWRVDEVGADGTVITGDVWSFSTGKMIGWWKLDIDASDSVGGNNGEILNGPQWVKGKVGGALQFDGNDDYVELPIGSLLSSLGSSTFAVWVNFEDTGSPWQRIFDFGSNTSNYMFLTPRTEYENEELRFAITAGGGYANEDVTSAPKTLPTGWHHVAVTINASDHTHILYLDGKIVAENTWTRFTPGSIGSTTNNWLGRSQYEPDPYFRGLLDDLRIYNYALSNEEVEILCSVKAIKPQPANGAAVSMAEKVELSWVPAIGTTSHKVYGGAESDKLELLAEVTESRCSKLPSLKEDATYYWRVDGIQANGDVVTGDVWSFTAAGKLVGWWKFDEKSGTTAYDSSGKGNNGTLHFKGGENWVAGHTGNALKFDPSDGNDYVDLPIGSVISSLRDCTVATWVNWSGQGGAWQRIFDFGMTGDTGHYIYLCPMSGEGNALRAALVTSYTGQWDEFDASTGPLATGWHHVAVTFDGGAQTMTMYLDGEVVGSETNCVNRLRDLGDANRNWLGRSAYSTDPHFSGSLDDFRIYNYALSEKEIKALCKK